MENSLLEVKNMNTSILENINFDLRQGEVHAIIGLGRSEKEEFIHGLTGMITVNGRIRYKDKPIKFDLSTLRNNGIKVLFENPLLIDHLSIADNISFGNFPIKKFIPFLKQIINQKQVQKKCKTVLNKVNLDLDSNTKINKLSLENKKLIYIGKIFIEKPEVIIMFEPTEGLNESSIQLFNDLISEFTAQGGSVIYISKQWEIALKIANRISVLSNGKISGTQNAKEAKKDPKKLINIIMGGEVYNSKSELEKESTKFLDGVFKAAEFLTSKYELKDVLQLLAEYTLDIMKADGCTINLVEESKKEIIDTVSHRKNDNINAVMKKNIIFKILNEDDIYYATEHEKGFTSLFEDLNNVKTVICVPVFIRSHVTGFIQVYYKNIYIYSKKESKYLSTLARQAAIAIEDTRLMGRSALLQESHHRIKNNLQYIISLITLQKEFIQNDDKNIEDVLNNIITRIKSIASVHDLLSKDELGRSIINTREIIDVIIEFFKHNQIEIICDLDDIFISYERASAIALIINELVNNCLKHAFKDQINKKIEISCKRNNGIILMVKDNGVGLPAGFTLDNLKSLGLSIVYSIVVKQFRGNISFKNNNGTEIDIELPL